MERSTSKGLELFFEGVMDGLGFVESPGSPLSPRFEVCGNFTPLVGRRFRVKVEEVVSEMPENGATWRAILSGVEVVVKMVCDTTEPDPEDRLRQVVVARKDNGVVEVWPLAEFGCNFERVGEESL